MSFKVVNTAFSSELTYGEERLRSIDAVLVNGLWLTEEELIEHSRDADAIICSAPSQPWTSSVLRALRKCRIIASLSIGFDRIDLPAATELGIVVTNIPDYCIDEVSSHAIALMMALGRKLLQMDRAVRESQAHFPPGNRKAISETLHPVFRTRDQTLGIIGFGRIGTAVSLKARGLGMKVVAYDPYVLGAVMETHGVRPVDFDTLLRTSDIISVNAALTDETRNMIGRDQLRKMKPTAYLVNTARGQIVDQDALIEALREGYIAGAGLDVNAKEPLVEEDPILQMPNVILTGHAAWYSTAADSGPEYWHKPVEQVLLALRGEWPTYAVNPEVRPKWMEKWARA